MWAQPSTPRDAQNRQQPHPPLPSPKGCGWAHARCHDDLTTRRRRNASKWTTMSTAATKAIAATTTPTTRVGEPSDGGELTGRRRVEEVGRGSTRRSSGRRAMTFVMVRFRHPSGDTRMRRGGECRQRWEYPGGMRRNNGDEKDGGGDEEGEEERRKRQRR